MFSRVLFFDEQPSRAVTECWFPPDESIGKIGFVYLFFVRRFDGFVRCMTYGAVRLMTNARIAVDYVDSRITVVPYS